MASIIIRERTVPTDLFNIEDAASLDTRVRFVRSRRRFFVRFKRGASTAVLLQPLARPTSPPSFDSHAQARPYISALARHGKGLLVVYI